MIYVPVPLTMLEVGRTIPVDVWDQSGKLLLRKGHSLLSEQHRDMLAAHQASMTEGDAQAWQRSHERVTHAMLRAGRSTHEIARVPMPAEILEADYMIGQDDQHGGWLVVRDRLQGLLYQAESAVDPLIRIEGLQRKALNLLANEPDECLFVLFQALADPTLGYCATHALLSAVVCELTAEKIGLPMPHRQALFTAALFMNIGMARAQDSLSTQSAPPNEAQRILIREHPRLGAELLLQLGVDDAAVLDIVRWHHEPAGPPQGRMPQRDARRQPDQPAGPPQGRMPQGCELLHVADVFVAKLAARKTRLAMSPLGAARSMVLDATGTGPSLASALATAVGFYPPGTYVQLVNGERAVVVARGPRAHDAHVVSIVNAGGLPAVQYLYRDTRESRFAIRSPVNAEKIRVSVNTEKAFKAWADGRS